MQNNHFSDIPQVDVPLEHMVNLHAQNALEFSQQHPAESSENTFQCQIRQYVHWQMFYNGGRWEIHFEVPFLLQLPTYMNNFLKVISSKLSTLKFKVFLYIIYGSNSDEFWLLSINLGK